MLQRIREWLVLFLVVLLPFHAFLVTVGTRFLIGPGHAPLPGLALWKEALLGLVLCVAFLEISRRVRSCHQYTSILVSPPDVLDWLIIGLLVLGVSVSATHYQLPTTHFLFGFKYTLFPLLLFLVFRRVSWSEHFLRRTSYVVLLTGAIVAVYGILTLFLSESFFSWLGYSDLHSLYLPDGPLAAFQKIEGTGIRRIQSTFSGPNQLGVWLLIPLSVGLMLYMERWRVSHFDRLNVTRLLVFMVLVVALFFTFSRAAWMGAAVIVLVLLTTPTFAKAPAGRHYSLLTRWKLLGYWVTGLFSVVVFGSMLFPVLFLRTASSWGHWERPLQAIRIIAAHPLGLGLGSAGPAANRTGDVCVFLEEGADVSWAADRPNLCVFRGDQQVQPFDYAPVQGPSLQGRGQGKPIPCHCPFLPENWYLQVGAELGWAGFLLYVLLVYLILNSQFLILKGATSSNFQAALFCTFLGISVAALFLHAWEDSAVAYTVWILLATVLQPPCRSRHSSLS